MKERGRLDGGRRCGGADECGMHDGPLRTNQKTLGKPN